MAASTHPVQADFNFEVVELANHDLVVKLSGGLSLSNASTTLAALQSVLKSKKPISITIDLQRLTYLDDYGALVLYELKQATAETHGGFNLINASGPIGKILTAVFQGYSETCQSIAKAEKRPNIFVQLGDATLRETFNIRYMISFLGSVLLAFMSVLTEPRALRLEDTIDCMKKTGADAVPIIGLISFLLGLIMAFMSSIQLQQFGANIYVASLVALAMVSELGPIMTAIVVAGRSSSSFAAEIGTMRISDEIDALYVMGFNPTLFLAVPRILAALIVVPLLTLFADLFAIAGGLFVGVFMLNLTPGSYISQTIETITLFEVLWSLVKSVVFAALIAWTGCLRGFQVRGGAAGVGNAATSAVVSSIFLIILFDSLFAVIRSYW
jgi:phospholipid/cholesterol/gamma-HCH transport system permease protein